MALVECRRFPLLPQALVARAALDAAGFHPFVFDEFRAAVVWTEQFAIGGVRVMIPEQELEPARQLLMDIDVEASSTATAGSARSRPWLFILLLVLGVVVGWPIAGFRRHDLFRRLTALAVTVLMVSFFAFLWLASRRYQGD